jgi:AraC family transcriptional regulator
MIRASSRHHFWSGAAGFSLKRFIGGDAYYRVDHLTRRVDPDHYFIVNEGQHYEIEIDSRSPVGSRCLFFRSGLIGDVMQGMACTAEWKLDHPVDQGFVQVPQQLCQIDDALRRSMLSLEHRYFDAGSSQLDKEESFYALGNHLLTRILKETQRAQALEAVKGGPKRELYRRVAIAHDFVLSNWEKHIGLEEIAKVASLSPNHLLRSFKSVYGASPGRFQQSVRLRSAIRFLQNSDQTITQIGQSCGFESLPSFIRLFRSRFGLSPNRFRKKVISDKT